MDHQPIGKVRTTATWADDRDRIDPHRLRVVTFVLTLLVIVLGLVVVMLSRDVDAPATADGTAVPATSAADQAAGLDPAQGAIPPGPPPVTVIAAGPATHGLVVVESDPLPRPPRDGADPAIGQAMPTVTGSTFDESVLRVTADSRPKVVVVVAHWCPHCRAEVPRLQGWLTDNGMPTDVDLVAIATGTDADRANHPPGDWLQREGWTIPTIADDLRGAAARAFGATGYPTFVAVDATGQVVARTEGELTAAEWEGLLTAARTAAPSS